MLTLNEWKQRAAEQSFLTHAVIGAERCHAA